jgi:HTH-type transcriptional regulator, transcriptional repressor of NAD biosynthesis genes
VTRRVGLVLGKFYPPHAGHHFLIDTAANACDTLYVLVLARDNETISLGTRMSWLSNAHAHQTNVEVIGTYDNTPIDYDDDAIWNAHVAIFSSAIASLTRHPVDTIFTSEAYGDELAARMGLTHVQVDLARTNVPLSATMVRSRPLAYADQLSPATRAGLAKRVVVVGAESTGTSTLAADLQHDMAVMPSTSQTKLVLEYGREYTLQKLLVAQGLARFHGVPSLSAEDLEWERKDFEVIAAEQNRREDLAARHSGLLLVCDTDAWTTGIWQQCLCEELTPEVASKARQHPLYLLTHHEGVPFVQDGIRSGEHFRVSMTEQFEAALRESGRPYVVLKGSPTERLITARHAVDDLLKSGWW